MSFQPVQKLVTLNDLEWHNGPYCIISSNLVAFEAHFTKVVEVEIVENKHSFDIVFFSIFGSFRKRSNSVEFNG